MVNRTFRSRTLKKHGRSEEMLGAVQRWGSEGIEAPKRDLAELERAQEQEGLDGRAAGTEDEPES